MYLGKATKWYETVREDLWALQENEVNFVKHLEFALLTVDSECQKWWDIHLPMKITASMDV